MLRILRNLLLGLLGLGIGAAIAYIIVMSINDQLDAEDSADGLASPDADSESPAEPNAFSKLVDRFQNAVEEGKRAAATAREELEAQAFGTASEEDQEPDEVEQEPAAQRA